MAKKKKDQLSDAYWDYLLEYGHAPPSVFKFCKDHKWQESDFYKHFGTFEAIERKFWQEMTAETITTLHDDQDYQAYDPRQKLLAFYYTYFEKALEERSRFLLKFPKAMDPSGALLGGMKQEFDTFAEQLVAEAVEADLMPSHKNAIRLFPKALWGQFRFLIDFYRRDSSEGFQDTDALIEKSVRFFFDSAKFPVLDSAFDLARFLFPRMTRP